MNEYELFIIEKSNVIQYFLQYNYYLLSFFIIIILFDIYINTDRMYVFIYKYTVSIIIDSPL